MERAPGRLTIATDWISVVHQMLAGDGNIYEPEPASKDAPLTPELVLNPYWRAMQNKSQLEKDEAFKKIVEINFSDRGFYLKRYHIAAAALVGANGNMDGCGYGSPLREAALHQDVALCDLLLQLPSLDPNYPSAIYKNAPILYVKKVFLAQLFLNAGTKLTVRGDFGTTYLHRAMQEGYEPQLVQRCIIYGMDPLAEDSDKFTPLHDLILYARHQTISDLKEKVDYLLEVLDFDHRQKLIKSVRLLIGKQLRITKVQWLNSYLQAMLNNQKIS